MENKRNFKEIAVVYLGFGDTCKRVGSVTGREYIFKKDSSRMPLPSYIDERDFSTLLNEKGTGTAINEPERLFMTQLEWRLALEQGVASNKL